MLTYVHSVGSMLTSVLLVGTVWTYVRRVTTVLLRGKILLVLSVSLINYPDMYGLIYQLLNRQNNLSHIFSLTLGLWQLHHTLIVICISYCENATFFIVPLGRDLVPLYYFIVPFLHWSLAVLLYDYGMGGYR